MKDNLLIQGNGQQSAMGIGRKFALWGANHSMNSGCVPCGGKYVELLSAVALACFLIWDKVCLCVLQVYVTAIVSRLTLSYRR